MKKIITISMLLLSLGAFSKPTITFSYDGTWLKFFLGGTYAVVKTVNAYEWQDGTLQCTSCSVTCKGDGLDKCDAVYKTAITPNPFTDPEQDLMHNLKIYANNQINLGFNTGSHSQSITIQSGTNTPETYIYTISWDINALGGNLIITNVLSN